MSLVRIIVGIFAVFCLITGGNALATTKHHEVTKEHHAVQKVTTAVNINTADAAALESLNGIGPKKAEAIVAYREQHGRFQSLEDLTAVRGIGSQFLARLQKHNPGRIVVE